MMKPILGAISWIDLTIPDAEGVRDFYRNATGWDPAPVDMGGYSDYMMNAPGTSVPIAGICHARGPNTDLPSQWLPYVTVEDLDGKIRLVAEHGGSVVTGPRDMGPFGRFAVIRDPAGAFAALIEPVAPPPALVPLPVMRSRAARALAEENEAARLDFCALLSRFPAEAFLTGNVDTEDNVRGILCHVTSCIFSYACWIQRVLGRLDPAREKEEKGDFFARVRSLSNAVEFEAATRFAATRYYAVMAEVEDKEMESEFKSNWGETLTVELMMEHALVHLLRHRRQLEIHLGMRPPTPVAGS